jgi:bleomycin hydrolase
MVVMVEGARNGTVYLNVSIEDMKKYTREPLEQGEPVWFGCDVGKFSHYTHGVQGALDMQIHDYSLVYGGASVTPTSAFGKRERLLYGESPMTHAMVITGFHVKEGSDSPCRWRIENSWGPDRGDKGYLAMADE